MYANQIRIATPPTPPTAIIILTPHCAPFHPYECVCCVCHAVVCVCVPGRAERGSCYLYRWIDGCMMVTAVARLASQPSQSATPTTTANMKGDYRCRTQAHNYTPRICTLTNTHTQNHGVANNLLYPYIRGAQLRSASRWERGNTIESIIKPCLAHTVLLDRYARN